jgi:ferritin-like metal-binding protein YciE
MTVKTMNDLFIHTLKDIYYAEKLIYKSLPKMAKRANTRELKAAFEKHREETEAQIERLEQIFESGSIAARSIKCEAIDGIIAEAKDMMEDVEDVAVLDAAIVSAAQAVEHYEITRYGTLIAWADQLGMRDASKLLKQTLAEEEKTDRLLSQLAFNMINKKAAA